MSHTLYFFLGLFILSAGLFFAKSFSRTFLAPTAIYLIFFFIHTILDPLLRESRMVPGSIMQPQQWEIVSQFNIYSLICAMLGVVVGTLVFKVRKPTTQMALYSPFTTPQSLKFLLRIIFALLAVAVTMLFLSGSFGGLRGSHGGYGQIIWEFRLARFVMQYAISSVIVFILLRLLINSATEVKGVWLLLPFLIIVLIDIATFGRQTSITVIVTLAVALFARSQRVSWRAMLFAGGAFSAVMMFAALRSLRLGVNEVAFGDIVAIGTEQLTYFMFTSLTGQEVFQAIVGYFDASVDQLFNGSTYFWNFLIALRLGFLVPPDYVVPSVWFYQNFLSASSYGRDFSMIAEAYINFGKAGSIVFLFTGFLVAWLSRIAYRTESLVVLAWATYMIVNLIVGLRNDSLPVFTRAIFGFLPLVIYFFVYGFLAAKSPKREPQTFSGYRK